MDNTKVDMKKFDVNTISGFGIGVYEAIEKAKTFLLEYPKKPKKPTQQSTGLNFPEDVTKEIDLTKKYQNELEQYQKDIEDYVAKEKETIEHNNVIYAAIDEYIREESGLNTIVPEKYRIKVYSHAYDSGHAYGYYEVYSHLCYLVDIFEN